MKLYNTLTRKKEDFIPLEHNKIKMYMCGPTVYNLIHIGNARPQIVFDTIRRYLIYKGYDVTFAQNFTDIDDKIIKKANEEGVMPSEIASRYIAEAYKDAEALNVKKADIYPRVTEEMNEIIEMINTLLKNGSAYEVNGSVFFDTVKANGYGKLSGKNIEDLEAGARVEVDTEKKHPSDFVLWKPAKPSEPYWKSPWGNGRPGWHIECSVMVKKYLGDTIDIHCGGDDLMFPHHENEIAQSEAVNNAPLAKYWLHNAMICVDNAKMSKSIGNFFLLREVAEKFSYEIVRFFILSAHYRSPLNFSDILLLSAKNSFERIQNCFIELRYKHQNNTLSDMQENEKVFLGELHKFREAFHYAMDDDFNTANAITAIFELVKFINTSITENSSKAAVYKCLEEMLFYTDVLGLNPENNKSSADVEVIEALIEKRQAARKSKNYAESDRIRDELLSMGIEIKDTREGVKWNVKN